MKKQKLVFVFLAVSLVLLAARFIFFAPEDWWRFPTKAEIYGSPAIRGNTVFFGNNTGELFAVNRLTGKQRWKFDTEHQILSQLKFQGDKILFTTADGILFCLNAKTGEELWRFHSEDHYSFYTDVEVYKNTVFVGDANGTLYAVNLKKGKLRWKFSSEPVHMLTDISLDSRLNWFGSFRIRRNTIYFADRVGTLYALSGKKGAIKWKFETDAPITAVPEFLGKAVYFGNNNGDSFAINRSDGSLIWHVEGEGSSLKCTQPHRRLIPRSRFTIEVYDSGDIVKRNGINGKKIWRESTGSKKNLVPSQLVFFLLFCR